MSLAWDNPPREEKGTLYRITYESPTGTESISDAVRSYTSIRELVPNTTYTFNVTPYGAGGQGEVSDSVSCTTPMPTPTPTPTITATATVTPTPTPEPASARLEPNLAQTDTPTVASPRAEIDKVANSVPVEADEREHIVEATAVAMRERSVGCRICDSVSGTSHSQRASFFAKMDYQRYIEDGNYFVMVPEGHEVVVPVGVGQKERYSCDVDTITNSLDAAENPTVNEYAHLVYVFIESEDGWKGCIGLSKDGDLSVSRSQAFVRERDLRAWRPDSMDVTLSFLTEDKMVAGDFWEYSRMPRIDGTPPYQDVPGTEFICSPEWLPIAFWNDNTGFYTVSNDDRLEMFPRANFDIDVAKSIGSGWFFVMHLDEWQDVSSAFCWRVPNWNEVPVRRCPVCQVDVPSW